MKYEAVQRSIEEFLKTNWSQTEIAWDNVPFKSDMYSEFVQLTVNFSAQRQRSLGASCFRSFGMMFLTVHVLPSVGTSRMLALADSLCSLLLTRIIANVPPNTAPGIQTETPEVAKNLKEVSGWVRAQVSCPFYYDLEI